MALAVLLLDGKRSSRPVAESIRHGIPAGNRSDFLRACTRLGARAFTGSGDCSGEIIRGGIIQLALIFMISAVFLTWTGGGGGFYV